MRVEVHCLQSNENVLALAIVGQVLYLNPRN